VVWDGRAPGIYETWEECKDQVEGFPGARYRAYPDLETATIAFRGDPAEDMALYRAMADHDCEGDKLCCISADTSRCDSC